MLCEEYGMKDKPIIVFIHGGGVSAWTWRRQVEFFQNDYHIYSVILPGHGEDYKNTFKSIEECASKIIEFINSKCGGRVFAICGFSLGAQITVEILSRESEIAKKAIIESAMVIRLEWLVKVSKPLYTLTHPLAKTKFFSKLQAKAMNIPDELFEKYYDDTCKFTLDSMLNMGNSNARYSLPASFSNNKADILVLCGSKEISNMKKSAELIARSSKNARLRFIENVGHGISLKMPDKYNEMASAFFENHSRA